LEKTKIFKVIIENEDHKLIILECDVGIMEMSGNNPDINKIELTNCTGIKYTEKNPKISIKEDE
jgi:hypothetical protein